MGAALLRIFPLFLQVLWASAGSHHWQNQTGRATPLLHRWHRWTARGHHALPAWHSLRSLQGTAGLIDEEGILVTFFVRTLLIPGCLPKTHPGGMIN